jgi:hypothetical protein
LRRSASCRACLVLLALGNVLRGAKGAQKGAVRCKLQLGLLPRPLDLAADQEPLLDVVGRALRRRLRHPVHVVAIVRVHDGDKGLEGHRGPLRHAEDPVRLLRGVGLTVFHRELSAVEGVG